MNELAGPLWADVLIGVLAIAGALCFFLASLAMLRVRDAIGRINVLSVATGIGVVLFVLAAFVFVTRIDGFSWIVLLQALVSIGATFVVTTVASMVLARAVYRTRSELDRDMVFDDLAAADE